LVQHKLTALRRRETTPAAFRLLVKELTHLLLYEATADLAVSPVAITTPVQPTQALTLVDELTGVLILRAGLGMLDGMLALLPDARVGHLGMFRNEDTLQPVHYYAKLPPQIAATQVLLLDPMLATGGSAVAALTHLRQAGVTRMRFVCLIASPEGVARLHAAFPDVPVYTAAVDQRVNERGYIVPGLGDAGDRLFATVPPA